jgi:hypothetical protein
MSKFGTFVEIKEETESVHRDVRDDFNLIGKLGLLAIIFVILLVITCRNDKRNKTYKNEMDMNPKNSIDHLFRS